MPIVIAPIDIELRVIRVMADAVVNEKLAKLGLKADALIKIISSENGNVICLINDEKIAIDKELGTKIFVAVA